MLYIRFAYGNFMVWHGCTDGKTRISGGLAGEPMAANS